MHKTLAIPPEFCSFNPYMKRIWAVNPLSFFVWASSESNRVRRSSILTAFLLILALDFYSSARADERLNSPQEEPTGLVYIPDGQLKSNPVRVYIANVEIKLADNPRLLAYSSNSIREPALAEFKPLEVVAGTEFITPDGVKRRGTLLLFNFTDNAVYDKLCGGWWSSLIFSMRFFPLVKWDVGSVGWQAAGEPGRHVIIGNVARNGWTMLFLLAITTWIIASTSKFRHGHRLALVRGEDGKASLSRLQLIAWTYAGAFCVGLFGLAKQDVPDIPASLIVLLGLSIATTGSAYALGAGAAAKQTQSQGQPPAPLSGSATPSQPPATAILGLFEELIAENSYAAQPVLSIAKAQMLIWTVVSLLLFVAKSLTNGEIWVIPWELVVLMGVSQTSYLVPKYWKLGRL